MRTIAVASLLLSSAGFATPSLIVNHEGRLLDSDDKPINTPVTLKFELHTLFSADGNDTVVWSDTYTGLPVTNGVYSVALGNTTGAAGAGHTALTADLFSDDRWLAVTVNGEAMTPFLRVGMVPVAAQALNALKLEGKRLADLDARYAMVSSGGAGGVTFDGGVTAASFAGDGSALTNLNAASVATGALADTRLSANVDLLNVAQTFTATKTFASVAITGTATGGAFVGDGSALTNLAWGNVSGKPSTLAGYGITTALLTPSGTLSGLVQSTAGGNSYFTGGNVGIGTTNPGVSLDLSGRTDAMALPVGTTAQRPASPMPGQMRWNTSLSLLEVYTGSVWFAINGFNAGAINAPTVQAAARSMLSSSASVPATGGSLAINGVALGAYDFVVKQGNQTVSAFNNSDWFTATSDTAAAFVVVNGSLTINAGQLFTPSARKLFTVLYVAGDLIVNGMISMTARGANHSATAAGNLLLATGTFSGVTSPQVPAAGGAGAANTPVTAGTGTTIGTSGADGTGGGTGGGGGGGSCDSSPYTRSAGSAGTSFTGGSGGGATIDQNYNPANNASSNGGAGGSASTNGYPGGGGAGNPGGAGLNSGGNAGASGTGGVLVVFCTGTLSGSGAIKADGSAGGSAAGNSTADSAGGGSGGGSVTVFYGTDSSSIAPTAAGGAGGTGAGAYRGDGGAGGAGTARKLSL